MKKFTMLASASLLVITGSAFAEQSLTDAQMDSVSAGALVLYVGEAGGIAYGNVIANLLSDTTTYTEALADPTGTISSTLGMSYGYGDSTSIATSVTNGSTIGGALAQSTSGAVASLF